MKRLISKTPSDKAGAASVPRAEESLLTQPPAPHGAPAHGRLPLHCNFWQSWKHMTGFHMGTNCQSEIHQSRNDLCTSLAVETGTSSLSALIGFETLLISSRMRTLILHKRNSITNRERLEITN
eukprot:TRINITY_DN1985_c3_g1_i9.p1 TRINITY_DN1985_c3_g1~~TRINITY_DN1985_c3_g1_i9.p1  ORF type:complete len:124 (-),score=12.90 TRINITY_DN1985_c3_g1_i9:362-733(-)